MIAITRLRIIGQGEGCGKFDLNPTVARRYWKAGTDGDAWTGWFSARSLHHLAGGLRDANASSVAHLSALRDSSRAGGGLHLSHP